MEKRVGIRLGLGVCSTPEGQMRVNLEEKINKMKGKGWEGRVRWKCHLDRHKRADSRGDWDRMGRREGEGEGHGAVH